MPGMGRVRCTTVRPMEYNTKIRHNREGTRNMKRLVIGILAHVDSGKTTLSEAMLYQRGGAAQAGPGGSPGRISGYRCPGARPGHHHFFQAGGASSCPIPRSPCWTPPATWTFPPRPSVLLQVMDYAILVISGTDGVQSHTETLWRLLERYRVPVFLFVNKMDLAGADRAAAPGRAAPPVSATGCVDLDRPRQRRGPGPVQRGTAGDRHRRAKRPPRISWPGPLPGGSCSPAFSAAALKLEGVDALLDALEQPHPPAGGSRRNSAPGSSRSPGTTPAPV